MINQELRLRPHGDKPTISTFQLNEGLIGSNTQRHWLPFHTTGRHVIDLCSSCSSRVNTYTQVILKRFLYTQMENHNNSGGVVTENQLKNQPFQPEGGKPRQEPLRMRLVFTVASLPGRDADMQIQAAPHLQVVSDPLVQLP